MRITRVCLSDFRNAEKECVEFSEGVNVLCGKNASGKTNLLEAVYLCAAGKSFRFCDEKNFIRSSAERSGVALHYLSDGDEEHERSVEVYHYFDGKKCRRQFRINGVKTDSASEAIGNFRAVIFTPDNLSIVKGAPEERRRFLDMVMSQASRNYIHCLVMYNKRLKYKNDLLRLSKLGGKPVDRVMLEAINLTLAEYAIKVVDYRKRFCERLFSHASSVYSGITQGNEELFMKYVTQLRSTDGESLEDSVAQISEVYNSMAESEISAGFTLFGPHRDDITMKLRKSNGEELSITPPDATYADGDEKRSTDERSWLAAKAFGSRGQQRSVVLSLKLAEGEMLKELTGEYPVFLLDDVFSELDSTRRSFILSRLSMRQVIVTCCDCDVFGTDGGKNYRVIGVSEGKYRVQAEDD